MTATDCSLRLRFNSPCDTMKTVAFESLLLQRLPDTDMLSVFVRLFDISYNVDIKVN